VCGDRERRRRIADSLALLDHEISPLLQVNLKF
jgi:hypothetical protein